MYIYMHWQNNLFHFLCLFRMTNGVSTTATNQEYQGNRDSEKKAKLFREPNSKNANILLKKKVNHHS